MGKVKFVIRKGHRILYEGGSWGFRLLVDKLENITNLTFEVIKTKEAKP